MKPRFISDIHLSENNPHLTDAFKAFLNESKKTCTHLFILGDLFEIWIGDDDDSSFIQDIKKAIIQFTTDGPETFLMHGNRDFLLGENFANEVGISLLPDPYTLDINGLKVILSHGDFLCTDDIDYINFRNQVRSKDWQNDFLSKSIEERKQIAQSLRSDSKKATSNKSLEITDVNLETINNFIQKNKPDIFIHGHTHRPKIHKHNLTKRVVLGDWDNYGWYFSIEENNLNLKKFKI
jgi:UDP-2,3-diacylglucosamine hydrolase